MSLVSQLAALAQPWADRYSASTTVQSLVMFTHLGGLLVGGGAAVTTDRATLRAARGDAVDRRQALASLRASHRGVVLALAVVLASGILLLGADVETLLGAPTFWVKMALVVALLLNGALITRAERPGPVALEDPVSVGERQWGALTWLARASLVLWGAVLLASVFLVTTA